MEFNSEIKGDRGYIVLQGNLDCEQSGELLRQAFDKVYERGKRTIVLDLSEVQILNSYGIGKILACHKKLADQNGKLMVKPLNGFVKDVFELLLLDRLIPTATE